MLLLLHRPIAVYFGKTADLAVCLQRSRMFLIPETWGDLFLHKAMATQCNYGKWTDGWMD